MADAKVLCVGEVMVELSGVTADGSARVGFGGDTGNTAIYLARLLGAGRTGYLTRLGDEPFGHRIEAQLRDEGISLLDDTCQTGRQTGLYAISVDDSGERSFTYWRDAAPAREILTGDRAIRELAWLDSFDALYVSGITLAIMQETGSQALLSAMGQFKEAGKQVMFDTNLRPALWARNWPGMPVADAYRAAIAAATIVKTGRDEVAEIFGPGDAADHLRGLGCNEFVITDGGAPIVARIGAEDIEHAPGQMAQVVDATAAGDSFNAGYLAARLSGTPGVQALRAGHALAACVIGYPGAIIPIGSMP